jgi:hypothetical protein
VVVELAEQLKKGADEIDNVVDVGDVEEGTPADLKKRADLLKLFTDLICVPQAAAGDRQAGDGAGQHEEAAQALVQPAEPDQGAGISGDSSYPLSLPQDGRSFPRKSSAPSRNSANWIARSRRSKQRRPASRKSSSG